MALQAIGGYFIGKDANFCCFLGSSENICNIKKDNKVNVQYF